MGKTPVKVLAGLMVVGTLVSGGCRNGAGSRGGYSDTPQMIGQAPAGYGTQGMMAGRTSGGGQRPGVSSETMYGGQPVQGMTPSNITTMTPSTSNAFGGSTVTTVPGSTSYPMPAGNMRNTEESMTRTPQVIGANPGQQYGGAPASTTSQYQTVQPQMPLAPGGNPVYGNQQ